MTARILQGMAPYPGQARCLALGFWPECFRRLDVKGGRRPFPQETRSALDIEGKHVTIQGPSPDLTSSVSRLLVGSPHMRQARSRCLQCCPRVAVMTLLRPLIGHAAGTLTGPESDRPILRIGRSTCSDSVAALHAGRFIPRMFRIMAGLAGRPSLFRPDTAPGVATRYTSL